MTFKFGKREEIKTLTLRAHYNEQKKSLGRSRKAFLLEYGCHPRAQCVNIFLSVKAKVSQIASHTYI